MGERQSAALDDVFNALCDSTRRAILARVARGDARITDIAGDFPISLNSISKHVRMLERAGLVHRSVNGREHVLSLNAAPLAAASKWIDHYEKFWDSRLAALEQYVLKKSGSRK